MSFWESIVGVVKKPTEFFTKLAREKSLIVGLKYWVVYALVASLFVAIHNTVSLTVNPIFNSFETKISGIVLAVLFFIGIAVFTFFMSLGTRDFLVLAIKSASGDVSIFPFHQ